MYYAAVNSYASETSIGFANTWSAIGFATRATRDAYVKRATDMATRAISASDLRKYGEKPGQVSHFTDGGEFMQHMQHGDFFSTGDTIDPATGIVCGWQAYVTDDVWE